MLVYHRGSSGVKYPGTLFTRVEKGNFAEELLNLIARLHPDLQRADTDLGTATDFANLTPIIFYH